MDETNLTIGFNRPTQGNFVKQNSGSEILLRNQNSNSRPIKLTHIGEKNSDSFKGLKLERTENFNPSVGYGAETDTVVGIKGKPIKMPRHGIDSLMDSEDAGGGVFYLKRQERIDINEGNYEEFRTTDLTEEEIQNRIKTSRLFGPEKSRDEIIAEYKKQVKENKRKNEILNNTKASNGLSYPEAKRIRMKLYEKYLPATRVRCPGSDGNLSYIDVVPGEVEGKMSASDRELYRKAETAIKELEQNKELMDIYNGSNSLYRSHTAQLESQFGFAHRSDGSHSKHWAGTKYVEPCPYF